MMIFHEIQKVNKTFNTFLWILLMVLLILNIFVSRAFLSGTISCFVFLILFSILKLEVSIYDDKIEYKLLPFHKSSKVITFDSIAKIERLSPANIGVFGFKIKSVPSGVFFYFGGDAMMRIRLKTGKIILIGTQRIAEMEQALNSRDKMA